MDRDVVYKERSFYGVHRVKVESRGKDRGERKLFNTLYHGTTMHGAQNMTSRSEGRSEGRSGDPRSTEPPESKEHIEPALADVPLTYFHREGPIGEVFRALPPLPSSPGAGPGAGRKVAVIGLGSGAMAAYAEPGGLDLL